MAETAMQRNVSETANGCSKRAGPHTSNSCISSSLRVYRGIFPQQPAAGRTAREIDVVVHDQLLSESLRGSEHLT